MCGLRRSATRSTEQDAKFRRVNRQPAFLSPRLPQGSRGFSFFFMSKKSKCAEQKMHLIEDLGARCTWCSRTDDLEFDCITPRGREHHGKSQCDRVRFYVHEYIAGNLQLLCRTCHARKSIEDKREIQTSRMGEFTRDTESGVRPVLDRGPEPSASDWSAWCAWHAKKERV